MSQATFTPQQIAALLARATGCDAATAAAFVREFAAVISGGVATDGVVEVPGFGVFKSVTSMAGEPMVDFAPDSVLADLVNEPFAVFESVELADGYDESDLRDVATAPIEPAPAQPTPAEPASSEAVPSVRAASEVAEAESVVTEGVEETAVAATEAVAEVERETLPPPIPDKFMAHPTPAPKTAPSPKTATAPTPIPTPDPAPTPDLAPVSAPAPTSEPAQAPAPAPQTQKVANSYDEIVPVRLEPESSVTLQRVGHSTLTLISIAVAALLMGAFLGFFLGRHSDFGVPRTAKQSSSAAPQEEVEVVETIEPVEPFDSVGEDVSEAEVRDMAGEAAAVLPSAPKEVTDTVRPGNYLSVMARRHYGDTKFWVYIYIENKDKIRNPDSLEDGMVLVIPPREKYGIDPNDPESLRKADREAFKVMQ